MPLCVGGAKSPRVPPPKPPRPPRPPPPPPPGRRRRSRPATTGRRPGTSSWSRGRACRPPTTPGRSAGRRAPPRPRPPRTFAGSFSARTTAPPTAATIASGISPSTSLAPRWITMISVASPPSSASGPTIRATTPPLQDRPDRRADQHRGERREHRHVVRVEDALGVGEHDRAGRERAARGEDEAGPRVTALQPRRDRDADPADDRHADQPARLAAERGVDEPEEPGVAAEDGAHAAAPAAARAAGRAARPAGLAVERGRCRCS